MPHGYEIILSFPNPGRVGCNNNYFVFNLKKEKKKKKLNYSPRVWIDMNTAASREQPGRRRVYDDVYSRGRNESEK